MGSWEPGRQNIGFYSSKKKKFWIMLMLIVSGWLFCFKLIKIINALSNNLVFGPFCCPLVGLLAMQFCVSSLAIKGYVRSWKRDDRALCLFSLCLCLSLYIYISSVVTKFNQWLHGRNDWTQPLSKLKRNEQIDVIIVLITVIITSLWMCCIDENVKCCAGRKCKVTCR